MPRDVITFKQLLVDEICSDFSEVTDGEKGPEGAANRIINRMDDAGLVISETFQFHRP